MPERHFSGKTVLDQSFRIGDSDECGHPGLFGPFRVQIMTVSRRALVAGIASAMVARPAFSFNPQQSGFHVPTGLRGDGVSDDTAALEAAIVSRQPILLPPGRFKISRELRFNPGQVLRGSSSLASRFVVDGSFDRNAASVLRLASVENSADVSDIGIEFAQPDTSDRGGLVSYPPAVHAVNAPRFKLSKIRIERATIGVEMRGNSGGATLTDIEVSAFDTGILIDGCLDSVKVRGLHIWPFGIGSRQKSIYKSDVTTGVRCGRCDDLHLSDGIIFGLKRAAIFERSKLGTAFGSISGMDFDDRGGLLIENANLRVSHCIFTIGDEGAQAVVAKSGIVDLLGCHVLSGASLPAAAIELGGDENLGVTIAGLSCTTGAADFVHLDVKGLTNLAASSLVFRKASDRRYSRPLVRTDERCAAAFSSVVASAIGSGSGTVFEVKSPANVRIGPVAAPGWAVMN